MATKTEDGAVEAAPTAPSPLDLILEKLTGLESRLTRVEDRTPSTRPMQGPQQAYKRAPERRTVDGAAIEDDRKGPYIPHGSRGARFTQNTIRQYRRGLSEGQPVRINPAATRPGGMGRPEYSEKRPEGRTDAVLVPMQGGGKLWRTVRARVHPDRAHLPRLKVGVFTVPKPCPRRLFEREQRARVHQFVDALAAQGWEIVWQARVEWGGLPLRVLPGQNPAIDMATGHTVEDRREYKVLAYFRLRNPQPLVHEILADRIEVSG